jgi:tRNA-specific 2-thiouridylase
MVKNKKIKIVVAMSGGVDSSVAAVLLKQAGLNVVGIMMKFWKEGADGKNRCCSVESEKLARLVAKKNGIPFYVVNVEKEFKKKVVDYFLKEYKAGNTPNPCVVCNKEIKFGFLIEKALKMGADFVATGHYATIKDGKLFQGNDKEKDQSYFLWQLNQKQLSRVLFPVGGYTKQEVRKLAKKFKLPTAETPESQEVCFVQDSTNEFLKKYLKTKPGKIVELKDVRYPTNVGCRTSHKTIGWHQGLWFYTIGQRRGLEIQQGPWFVIAKDFKKNILIVSKNQKDLFKKEFIAKNVNWTFGKEPKLPIKVKVQIRYRTKPAAASLIRANKRIDLRRIKVIFDKPQKAITSGQSAVFYEKDQLLGGGIIL